MVKSLVKLEKNTEEKEEYIQLLKERLGHPEVAHQQGVEEEDELEEEEDLEDKEQDLMEEDHENEGRNQRINKSVLASFFTQ